MVRHGIRENHWRTCYTIVNELGQSHVFVGYSTMDLRHGGFIILRDGAQVENGLSTTHNSGLLMEAAQARIWACIVWPIDTRRREYGWGASKSKGNESWESSQWYRSFVHLKKSP